MHCLQINEELVDHQLQRSRGHREASLSTSSEIAEFSICKRLKNRNRMFIAKKRSASCSICLYLLVSDELLSLVHIYDFSGVSRTTASADLKAAARFLSTRQLKLKYTRQAGYFIEGSELAIRNLLNYLVTQLLKYDDGRSSMEQLGKRYQPNRSFILFARLKMPEM